MTQQVENREEIRQSISRLLGIGQQEHFEDGMENDFSRGLTSLIETYAEPAVEELAALLESGKVNAELAAETLVCLGRIEEGVTYLKRRTLLEEALSSSSHFIRDGALVGLSYLDDPHAISHLRLAIEREMNTQLRRYMQQLLREVEAAS